MTHRDGGSIAGALVLCLAFGASAGARGQQLTAEAEAAFIASLQKAQATALEVPKSQPLDSLGIRGFSVALVVGDMEAASPPPDTLPIGAKKALADMRDFLPYKNYHLLDAQWILCCGNQRIPSAWVGRVRGVDEQKYTFIIRVTGVSDSRLAVHFTLQDPSESLVKVTSAQGDTKTVAVQAPFGNKAKGPLIDSTFSMDVGETVVIGTSSLKGDKALIALLTAARRPTGSSKTQER